jgi:hypothetical protein
MGASSDPTIRAGPSLPAAVAGNHARGLIEKVLGSGEHEFSRCFGHCEERSDEAIQPRSAFPDCFAEPVIRPRVARTGWLAMTL